MTTYALPDFVLEKRVSTTTCGLATIEGFCRAGFGTTPDKGKGGLRRTAD
jgi:hypothetical protein